MENKIDDLLTRCRMEVVYSHQATMPIPLYEEIKKTLYIANHALQFIEQILTSPSDYISNDYEMMKATTLEVLRDGRLEKLIDKIMDLPY